MAKKKVVSYEEKNYNKKKELYGSIVQCLEDMKFGEVMGGGKWNIPAEKISGLTYRLVGENHLELTYHHYEVTTVEGLAHMDDDGKSFVKEVVKELKKRFRKRTGKALDLKEIKYDRSLEKVSRMQADTSWMVGSSRYGYQQHPAGRYLVRDTSAYSFDEELLK
jgi:hypothetical protein